MLIVLNEKELNYLREIMIAGINTVKKDENLLSLYDKVGGMSPEIKCIRNEVEEMLFTYVIRCEYSEDGEDGEQFLAVNEKELFVDERVIYRHPKRGDMYFEIVYKHEGKISKKKATELNLIFCREIDK